MATDCWSCRVLGFSSVAARASGHKARAAATATQSFLGCMGFSCLFEGRFEGPACKRSREEKGSSCPMIAEMNGILLVALGGAVGSVARFKLSGLVLHHTVDW